MSKDVVKVEAELIPASTIVSALREPVGDSSSLVLNPGFAMPTEFPEAWAKNEQAVQSWVSSELTKAQKKELADYLNVGRVSKFFRSKRSVPITILASIPVFLSGVALAVGVEDGIISSGIMLGDIDAAMILALILGVSPALVVVWGASDTRSYHVNRLEEFSNILDNNIRVMTSQVKSISDEQYQSILSQWAKERYGFTMSARWASSRTRLADDIAYVGEKDARKVYCQERPEGWVLTYNDGTELPVLAKKLATV